MVFQDVETMPTNICDVVGITSQQQFMSARVAASVCGLGCEEWPASFPTVEELGFLVGRGVVAPHAELTGMPSEVHTLLRVGAFGSISGSTLAGSAPVVGREAAAGSTRGLVLPGPGSTHGTESTVMTRPRMTPRRDGHTHPMLLRNRRPEYAALAATP